MIDRTAPDHLKEFFRKLKIYYNKLQFSVLQKTEKQSTLILYKSEESAQL